jgi:septum formation protein
MPTAFVLASRSPRRIALLREAGFAFDVDPADVDEDAFDASLTPEQVARHLASLKARTVARRHPGLWTLGSDTVVAVGQTLYGKPLDHADARRMMRATAGREQQVITGVAMCRVGPDAFIEAIETSLVRMRPLTDVEIDVYVAGGDWRGKAGGYGIQDERLRADPFVTLVSGSLSNVVGLPMETTVRLLGECGIFPSA